MVETTGRAAPKSRWVWTTVAAFLAFLTVGYSAFLLLASAYSAAFDSPTSPAGVALAAGLTLVPIIVGLRSYRRGRRRGLAKEALVRRVSLILLGVGIALLIAVGLLAGPI